jgi:hypothetical protein
MKVENVDTARGLGFHSLLKVIQLFSRTKKTVQSKKQPAVAEEHPS